MKGLLTDNKTGDLLVDHKTAAVDNCEEQVIECVLMAARGEFKELPLIGAEVRQHIGGTRDVFWPTETKKMIKAVGVDVHTIQVDADGVINIK